MRSSITIEMAENEHGLIGCGDITFTYLRDGAKTKGFYKFVDKDYVINVSSEDASNIYKKLVVEEETDINIILRMAADSCGIPLFRIKEKSNNAEVVFARYLVFWYIKNHLNFSLKAIGDIFRKNHATVIHGIKIISDDPKYLKGDQRIWRKVFMDKLKDNNLI